jgi:hypothetical protein
MDPRAVLKKVARYFQIPESHLTAKRTGRRGERGIALELSIVVRVRRGLANWWGWITQQSVVRESGCGTESNPIGV